MSKQDEVNELSEDMVVIGPGQMLAEAREAMGLSQHEVADRLNFRVSLVKDIENEVFDKSLPPTFNRGYLRNYSKLVKISEQDVLSSYEMLDVAEKQGAEMQSFSKATKKQAENSRIMWVSYLILAGILGSTLVWWYQARTETVENTSAPKHSASEQVIEAAPVKTELTIPPEETEALVKNAADETLNESESQFRAEPQTTADSPATGLITIEPPVEAIEDTESGEALAAISEPAQSTNVTFFFKGDCWVNIYDASGERLAWGVKKTDYVMTIEGQPPFSITLGKPELVEIQYGDQDIDMSQFNAGNIAKFNLPLSAE